MMGSYRFIPSVFGLHGPPRLQKGGRWLVALLGCVFLGTIVATSSGRWATSNMRAASACRYVLVPQARTPRVVTLEILFHSPAD
jgi:hypothetical protein